MTPDMSHSFSGGSQRSPHPLRGNLQLNSRSFLWTRGRGWGCSESCLQEEQKRVGGNMEIKIHGGMYEQAETSNQGAGIVGEIHYPFPGDEILPTDPSQ